MPRSIFSAVTALKLIAGLHQARVAHHRIHGPDTQTYSRGRRITKKLQSLTFVLLELFSGVETNTIEDWTFMLAHALHEIQPRIIRTYLR